MTSSNTGVLADSDHPVKAGDVIVIYCSGLGMVNAPVADGRAAPASLLSLTDIPSVPIGGKSARVLFSGLTPGFVGLYQVNVAVPDGVTPGGEVPLVISLAGQTGPVVTIGVR